jgi:hypothetical protein
VSDLIDFLQERGIDHRLGGEHHHVSPGWVGIDCPDCSPSSGRYRLGIHAEHLYATCWSCGPKGTAWALSQVSGVPYRVIREVLGNRLTQASAIASAAPGRLKRPTPLLPLKPPHRRYLEGRGFDADTLVQLWGLLCTDFQCVRYPWRLYVPVLYRGREVSWTTRSLSDKAGVRYSAAPAQEEALPAKSVLYGLDYCRHAVVVVEGPTDVWRVGPGAAATFGSAWTSQQADLVAQFPLRVICYDSEPAAQRRAEALCRVLAPLPGETYRITLKAKDPGSASEREINTIRKRFLE